MSRKEFDFDNFKQCPECGSNIVAVETVVTETAMHRDGRREFKGGGAVIAELSVRCEECTEKIWGAYEYEVVEGEEIEHGWKPTNRCPECNSSRIEEWHVDDKIRQSDGTLISDGDRFRTEAYYCSSCRELLHKLES